MNRLGNIPRRALAALAVVISLALAAPCVAGPAPAVDDDTRQRVLHLNEITGEGPLKGQVLALLEKPAEAKKLLAAGVRMAKEKPQPLRPNAALALATIATQLKDYESAEAFYRVYADHSLQLLSSQGLSVAYGGLITVLYNAKKYAETEKVCREFLDIDGDEAITRLKPRIFERMVLAMALRGQTDKALEVLNRLIKAQPDDWLTLEIKGRVLRFADRNEDALKVYEEVADKIKNDKRLKKAEQEELLDEMYRYPLSGVYVELNQIDKAAEQLKTLLTREPNNPTYNNDLGYVWADHDMNLAESEKLIRKALEEDRRNRHKANPDIKPEDDKDNAAYLDSLAWVLFKQKKYAEAKPLLEQAVQDPDGKHVEIYDHLGDALMALGEKSAAVAAWKEGVKVAGPSKREKQRKANVEKKLKDAK
jgi:tetratricopeptide (TPR) repeat protein